MTERLSLAEPAAETDRPGSSVARLAPATRRRLGTDVGTAVRVVGDDTTVAIVGEDAPSLSADAVLVGDAVTRNADASVGAGVTVAPVAVQEARTVTLSPTRSFSFEGDAGALSRALVDRPLTVGDRVEAALFGGSIVVPVTVLDTDPADPVVVTPETDIVVQEGVDAAGVPTEAADALGGLDDERARLHRLVAAPLSDRESYADLGARTPAGVLVSGPTGTGKTRLVRSVAAAADLPVRSVAPSDAKSRDALSTVLDDADDVAPAILFVEDLAAAAPDPDEDGSGRSDSQLGWLLDRVRDRDDLVVVGETTRPDGVDPEVRRGGRFDAEVRVETPDASARREIVAAVASDLRLARDVDLDGLASRTHGYTGADLESVFVKAATRAAGRADNAGTDPAVRQADVEAALETTEPTTLRGVAVERPSTTYRDIGGLEEAKREVIRAVEWPLRYPELFERLSADAPAGVLLYGPPGTGKTMLAKAVANSTDANFIAVDGPELMNRYVGESERGVREVFERARRTAPSVVFLDELDALAPARRQTDTGAAERVVSQLLTELDGLSARGSVVVLAATNRRDGVDPALLRPGRIERQVAVPLPNEEARAAVLAIHLNDVPTRNVDADRIAAATEGYSGSDLAGLVRGAALLAMEDHLRAERDSVDDLVVENTHLRRALANTQPSGVRGAESERDEVRSSSGGSE